VQVFLITVTLMMAVCDVVVRRNKTYMMSYVKTQVYSLVEFGLE
jgi:hypothetical protein